VPEVQFKTIAGWVLVRKRVNSVSASIAKVSLPVTSRAPKILHKGLEWRSQHKQGYTGRFIEIEPSTALAMVVPPIVTVAVQVGTGTRVEKLGVGVEAAAL
jgi:hypothetical protein